jgi:ubiquinone/menaquinone biosynthesis C-methylase UbiE
LTLNLGAGTLNRERGEVGYDINLACKPDICGDASSLPFKDESFDDIKAVHVLEHIDNIVKAMDECYRVLKKGGRFHVRVPHFPHIGSIADPTHKRYFVSDTFGYFVRSGALSGLQNVWNMGGINTTEQEIYVVLRKQA